MTKITDYKSHSGRFVSEDGTFINIADIISSFKAKKASVLAVGADVEPINGITSNSDIAAQLIFADDATAVTVNLISGVVYPYSIKKVVAGDGIVGLY